MLGATSILYWLGYNVVFSNGFIVKRATCPDPWQNVPNPCLQNPQNKVYFPHPSDTTKFLQCDAAKKMYMIQCPKGEVYDAAQSTCIAGKVTIVINGPNVVTRPVTSLPATPTKSPTVTPALRVTTASSSNIQNPCTNANLANGSVYFPHPTDPSKFIQCDLLGKMLIEQCNTSLVWDQNRLSCVYNFQPGVAIVRPTPAGSTTAAPTSTTTAAITIPPPNPCTPQNIAQGRLFHPHPTDTHKFIQCTLWGDALLNDCPQNLIWNQQAETCSASYLAIG